MLLILLSWTYIFITAVNFGCITNRFFRLKMDSIPVTAFLGLFTITILAGFWALFTRVNFEFHMILLLINLLIWFRYRIDIQSLYRNGITQFQSFSPSHRLLLCVIGIIILANSAAAPFIVDNESYYIQTIKWLNEYGYVHGVANLHIFLGQQSGWHLTQSALNFSFLYSEFNDLGGFCLLLGNFFAFSLLQDFSENRNRNSLIFGLFPIFNVLLLQFANAPSPDLPVYILTFLIVYYFVAEFNKATGNGFIVTCILTIFAVFIKSTAAGLVVFPMILIIRNFTGNQRDLFRILGAVLALSVLFVSKNYVTSGHPLFPIVWSPGGAHAVPDTVANFYFSMTKLFGYRLSLAEFNHMSATDLFITWLQLPKLHGFFNWLLLVLVAITPFFLLKIKQRQWWLVYSAMLFQIAILAISSPQYRFFLHFILLFLCVLLSVIIPRRLITSAVGVSTFIAVFVTLTSINLSSLTNNPLNGTTNTLGVSNLVFPHADSNRVTAFIPLNEGNLQYYSPADHPFFWGTGDGPLPCVHSAQIEYFKKHLRVVPQPLGSDLSDGFYARELSPIE